MRRVTMLGNAYRHGVNVGGLNSEKSPVPKASAQVSQVLSKVFHYNTSFKNTLALIMLRLRLMSYKMGSNAFYASHPSQYSCNLFNASRCKNANEEKQPKIHNHRFLYIFTTLHPWLLLLPPQALASQRAASSRTALRSRARWIHAWSSMSRPNTSLLRMMRITSARPMAFSGPPNSAPVRLLTAPHCSTR